MNRRTRYWNTVWIVVVYADEKLAHFRGDVYTNVMEDCIKTVKPTVVLVGATSLGRSLAPACATRFRTGLTADCLHT